MTKQNHVEGSGRSWDELRLRSSQGATSEDLSQSVRQGENKNWQIKERRMIKARKTQLFETPNAPRALLGVCGALELWGSRR